MAALSGYSDWRSDLYGTTRGVLRDVADSQAPISDLHKHGVYHKIPREHGEPLMARYSVSKEIPSDWVSKGFFPGVWCALFGPHNTYSMASDLYVLRITFKAEYKVFDPANSEHVKLWGAWKSVHSNMEKTNDWATGMNSTRESMRDRMASGASLLHITLWPSMPEHVEFYRENKFGAVVGYSDYMGLVVVLPECIESLEKVVG